MEKMVTVTITQEEMNILDIMRSSERINLNLHGVSEKEAKKFANMLGETKHKVVESEGRVIEWYCSEEVVMDKIICVTGFVDRGGLNA